MADEPSSGDEYRAAGGEPGAPMSDPSSSGDWQVPPGWHAPPGSGQGPPPGGWQGPPQGAWYATAPGPSQGSPWPPYGPGYYPGPPGWDPNAGLRSRRTPRTPEERRRRLRRGLLFFAVFAVAVGIGIGIGAWIAPTSPSAVAKGLVSQAVTAATGAGSFHYVEVSTTDGTAEKFVGTAGATSGTQTIVETSKGGGTDIFRLRLVKGVVYFKGNTAAVVDELGVAQTKASTVAGHWVKVVKGEAPYKTFEQGITAKSNIAQLSSTFVARSSSAVAGASPAATRIRGGLPAKGSSSIGTASLVIATSTSLPERFTAQATSGTASATFRWTFSKYHEKVSVAAPSGALAYSSLGAKPPSSGG